MQTAHKTLKSLCKRVRLIVKFGARLDYDKQDEWQQNENGFTCTLRYKGRQYTFDFWQGTGIQGDPTAEGVMECLLSDASCSPDFNEFCSEFGYDADSRKAERIHKACLKTREHMERLLGDEFKTFLYADRD